MTGKWRHGVGGGGWSSFCQTIGKGFGISASFQLGRWHIGLISQPLCKASEHGTTRRVAIGRRLPPEYHTPIMSSEFQISLREGLEVEFEEPTVDTTWYTVASRYGCDYAENSVVSPFNFFTFFFFFFSSSSSSSFLLRPRSLCCVTVSVPEKGFIGNVART